MHLAAFPSPLFSQEEEGERRSFLDDKVKRGRRRTHKSELYSLPPSASSAFLPTNPFWERESTKTLFQENRGESNTTMICDL